MRDHQPIQIEDFKGYWNRGDIDTCPLDHFTECINMRFLESGYTTRYGISVAKGESFSVLRMYPYLDTTAGPGYLVLLSNNTIYHIYGSIGSWTTHAILGPITNMTDFAFVSINSRAYVSPCGAGSLIGLAGEFVYVYDGLGINTARKAAGDPPKNADGVMAAANSATAGNVQPDVHVYGVVYETDTGFLTQIGPDTLVALTSPGNKKVDLSSISKSPLTYVTKRHIVATKAIATADWTGDTRAFQFYFVPGGTINDNTTTTLTINFYDSELIEDASHLLDIDSFIIACGGLGTYHNRMIGWNFTSGPGQVLVSDSGEPEAFNTLSGFLVTIPEGFGITYCQEYRDILYVFKSNKTVAFSDNQDIPTSWPSAIVDQGFGCGKHGMAVVGTYGGTNVESLIMIDSQGIHPFSGTFNTPELSYKIKDYWLSLNKDDIKFGAVSIYNDPLNQLLIVSIGNTNIILVGDYSNGLTAQDIKWTKWDIGTSPNTILLWDSDNKLFIGTATGTHYIDKNATADTFNGSSAVKIPNPTTISALIPDSEDNFNHYGGIRLRVSGSGNLFPTLLGLDSTVTQTLGTMSLSSNPGKELFGIAGLVTQRARLQLQTTAINAVMKINRLVVYIKALYTQSLG